MASSIQDFEMWQILYHFYLQIFKKVDEFEGLKPPWWYTPLVEVNITSCVEVNQAAGYRNVPLQNCLLTKHLKLNSLLQEASWPSWFDILFI